MNRIALATRRSGFTIVELLIVIVVIGILAAISIVAYSGIQDRARQTKIQSDLSLLEKAINAGRVTRGSVSGVVTGSWSTGGACISKPDGTDLAQLPRTDGCWVAYLNTLQAISLASGIQIKNLTDPWGRPYMIDENENEGGPGNCTRDYLRSYKQPFLSGWNGDNSRELTNVSATCL